MAGDDEDEGEDADEDEDLIFKHTVRSMKLGMLFSVDFTLPRLCFFAYSSLKLILRSTEPNGQTNRGGGNGVLRR